MNIKMLFLLKKVTDAIKAILMISSDRGNSPEESSVVEVKLNEIQSH